MIDAEFFRKQAARCLRLSRSSYDMETCRQLRMMASEFEDMAERYGNCKDYILGELEGGSPKGGMDRG